MLSFSFPVPTFFIPFPQLHLHVGFLPFDFHHSLLLLKGLRISFSSIFSSSSSSATDVGDDAIHFGVEKVDDFLADVA